MPIRDIAAQNASLNNDYGATHGPNAPTAFEVALFDGDPLLDGVELDPLDCPGYVRAALANDASWLPAVDGLKVTAAPVQFADATAEWASTVSHWGLLDAADSVTMWDSSALTEPVDVGAAGAGPAIELTTFYDTHFDD